MNLSVFEHDRWFVIRALHRGGDYLEDVSEPAEPNWFRQLIDRPVLERLAEIYARRLRLHGAPADLGTGYSLL
jgi:hypothetical protein